MDTVKNKKKPNTEFSPSNHGEPTNVAWVRFPGTASYVCWVCCWFSALLREIFLRLFQFTPLLKNQHFQIPIPSAERTSTCWTSSQLWGAPLANKLHIHFLFTNENTMFAYEMTRRGKKQSFCWSCLPFYVSSGLDMFSIDSIFLCER